jgi:hypothetical protein
MSTATQLLERCKATINELWAIIDDIDSYGDMAKDDDKLFRKLVEHRQLDRWSKTDIRTDGYSLTEGIAADVEAYLTKQQVEQEPVGYVTLDGEFVATSPTVQKHGLDCGKGLYTSPQTLEPLSDEELDQLMFDCGLSATARDIARAIEAHHGIK